MAKSSEIIVEFNCLKHTYFDKTTVATCGLEFKMHKKERVVILGPNGCGKSTLLKHILGLIKPSEGKVLVFGENPASHFAKIRPKIGAVLQDVEDQLIGPTVYDDVAFTLRNLGKNKEEINSRVENILKELNIDHLREKMIYYLSGGEKKKVAIAGAIAHEPELLVLDEPFENLDYLSTHQIADYLNKLNKEKGTSIIYASHDLHLVSKISDTLYFLYPGGQIGLFGPTKETLSKVKLDDYLLERHHL